MSDDVGSLLLRSELVNKGELDAARAASKSDGGTIPENLVRQGAIEDEKLTVFYRTRLLIPRVAPSDLAKVPRKVIEKIPSDMATELRAVPMALDNGNNLTVIMSDPSDARAVDEIAFFTGAYVVRAVATQAQIAWCLAHYYQMETPLYHDLVEQGHWPQAKAVKLRAEARQANDSIPLPIDDSDDFDEDTGETGPMQTMPRRRREDFDDEDEDEGQTGPMKTMPRARRSAPSDEDYEDDEDEGQTGPMKTMPRPKKRKGGEIGSQGSEIETGPMRVRKRPKNQQPSPPELFSRAGEIQSVKSGQRHVSEALPAVMVDLGDSDSSGGGTVQKAQRGTDTAPIILSAEIRKKFDEELESPIVLDRRKRRRSSRVTQLGIAPLPAKVPMPESSAPKGQLEAAGAPVEDATDPMTQALPPEDRSGPGAALTDVEAEPADSLKVTDEDLAPPTEEERKAAMRARGKAPKIKGLGDTLKDVEPRVIDRVNEPWGEPGTTIPPAYLGATPGSYDESAIPQVIDGDDTSQHRAVEAEAPTEPAAEVSPQNAPAEAEDTAPQAAPEPVSDDSDRTVPNQEPTSVRRVVLENSATKVLDALREIEKAENRDQVVEPILDFLDIAYAKTGFLVLRQDRLRPWRIHGVEDEVDLDIDTEQDTVFRDVIRMRLPYNGPVDESLSSIFTDKLGVDAESDLLALPLTIRDRAVGVVFGVTGQGRLFEEHLAILLRAASDALERLVKSRKK